MSVDGDSEPILTDAIAFWRVRVEESRNELTQAEEKLLRPFRDRLAFVEGRLESVQRRLKNLKNNS